MNNHQLLTELTDLFRSVFENPNLQISPATSAKDIHNWDSMHHILLISEIEIKFAVEFELDDLIAINNVADILAALQAKVK